MATSYTEQVLSYSGTKSVQSILAELGGSELC